MGKKKTETTQTQTNTYGFMTPTDTPDISTARAAKAQLDPSIPFNFARQKEDLIHSYTGAFGAQTSPAVREAMMRNTNRAFAQNEAQANAESQYNADNQNYARAMTLAQLTAPRMVQTGGTMTGTQTQSGGFWSNLLMAGIGAGSNLGAASMMRPKASSSPPRGTNGGKR